MRQKREQTLTTRGQIRKQTLTKRIRKTIGQIETNLLNRQQNRTGMFKRTSQKKRKKQKNEQNRL